MKVTVTNFTTYSYAEFSLSPTLNMIIGPNGTGKSTLVSAICLGLGGKPELIKRPSLKDMIKSGENRAEVTITMMGNGGRSFVIERSFDAKSSEWKVDNKKVAERFVQTKVKELNIQLDNLCHFLPQERVAEFAGLSPEKLLLETQRTLKNGDLHVMHESLIALEKDRDAAAEDLKNIVDNVDKLTSEREILQEEVERLNQFNDKATDLKYHELLLPYAISNDDKEKKRMLKKQRDDAKAKLNAFDNNADPLHKEVTLCLRKVDDLKAQIFELRSEIDQSKEQYKRESSTVQKITSSIQEMKEELQRTKIGKETIRKELELLNSDVQDLRTKYNELGELDALTEERDEFYKLRRDKNSTVTETMGRLEAIRDNIESQEREVSRLGFKIKEQEAVLNTKDKLSMLNPSSNGSNNPLLSNAYHIHQELRKRPELKQYYFESPVVTCDVTEKSVAPVIEKIINPSTLMSLTFTSEDAYNKIPNILFKNFNSPTRIIVEQASEPQIAKSQISGFGFQCYLSDFLVGPSEVINMINSNSKLNWIPYAPELSQDQVARLLNPDSNGRIPFMRFAVGNQLITVHKSKYGAKQFVSVTETVTRSKFFGKENVVPGEVKKQTQLAIESLKSQQVIAQDAKMNHEAEKEQLLPLVQQNKNAFADIDKQYREVKEQIQRKSRIKEKIERTDDLIKRKTRELSSSESSKLNKYRKRILNLNVELATGSASKQAAAVDITSKSVELNNLVLERFQHETRASSIKALVEEIDQYKEELVKLYEEANANYRNIRESDASKKIKEQKKHYTEKEERDLAKLAEKYLETNSLNQIYVKNKIQLIRDELSVLTAAADRNCINRLKEVEAKLEEYENTLPRYEKAKLDLDARIEKIQSEWEPELTKLVFRISLSFKKKFVAVASDGEVRLKKQEKFKDWRLEILVKFRQESELKILDRQSQSGGERAVSTIFFVMALQGLTQAPVRIVDEINQGMDPTNEKQAHKFLVHTASKASDSQYFLVTPKLLTGLYYHPSMKIHCIFTGPLIDPFRKNDVDFMDFTDLH
ncbi:Structural maintenance of chromosomes protein 5 [Yamadazyma tenuis]|nr:Structural maintenance of chromosomes protein 5 [Yamadazyma tenuis]